MKNILSVIVFVALMLLPALAISNNSSQTSEYYYVVTLECKQSHLTLDLSEHLKDSMNKLRFDVPVDKDFYNKVSVGEKLTDSFRMGSFIRKGSLGKWKVTVIDKKMVRK